MAKSGLRRLVHTQRIPGSNPGPATIEGIKNSGLEPESQSKEKADSVITAGLAFSFWVRRKDPMCDCGKELYSTSASPWMIVTTDSLGNIISGT